MRCSEEIRMRTEAGSIGIRSRRSKRTVKDNNTFTFNVIGFVYDIEIR